MSIVLRHAKREEITDATNSLNVPLVDEGRKMAVKLGEKLSSRFMYNLYHSDVPRCIETAYLILQGIRESKNDEISKVSGEKKFLGGFYLLDFSFILDLVNNVGGDEFITKWYGGALEEERIIPFQKTSNLMIKYILETMDEKNNNEIDFFITHDWNIIPIMSKVMDITGSDFFWPSYFEPIILEKNDDEIQISFREFYKRLDYHHEE